MMSFVFTDFKRFLWDQIYNNTKQYENMFTKIIFCLADVLIRRVHFFSEDFYKRLP